MQLLQEVDKPGSDVETYASSLDTILAQKMEAIVALRNKLKDFQAHLKDEKELSKQFLEQQNEIQDVFDLQKESEQKFSPGREDTEMLTNDLDIRMEN